MKPQLRFPLADIAFVLALSFPMASKTGNNVPAVLAFLLLLPLLRRLLRARI